MNCEWESTWKLGDLLIILLLRMFVLLLSCQLLLIVFFSGFAKCFCLCEYSCLKPMFQIVLMSFVLFTPDKVILYIKIVNMFKEFLNDWFIKVSNKNCIPQATYIKSFRFIWVKKYLSFAKSTFLGFLTKRKLVCPF